MKIYRVMGEMLSPVHIGTNHVWEPFEYFIDSSKKLLYPFSTEDIISKLDDTAIKRFNELTESDDLNILRGFIVDKARDIIN